MHNIKRATVLVTVRSVLLCAPCSVLSAPCSAQSLDREIRAEVRRYVAAVISRDADGVAALYDKAAGTATLGDGDITPGWQAVRAVYADAFRSFRSLRMDIPGDTVVVALGADAALAFFPYKWTIAVPGRTIPLTGAMTLIYRRTAAGWRIVQDHTSSSPASLRALAEATGGRSSAAPLGAGSPEGPRRATENCVITRIVDGDTVHCDGLGPVRLIGIDTPERDQAPFGAQATEALTVLAPVGARVRLERDVEGRDRYGRLLGYLWLEGALINWAMVRGGFAVTLTIPPNVQYADALADAQRRARDEGAGLWAGGGFDCSPERHRRKEC